MNEVEDKLSKILFFFNSEKYAKISTKAVQGHTPYDKMMDKLETKLDTILFFIQEKNKTRADYEITSLEEYIKEST